MKIFRSILFAIAGAFSIFCGTAIGDEPIGEIVELKEYGGDAYSGIQQANAVTTYNTFLLTKIIKGGLNGILIGGGIALFACAIPTNLKKKED